MKYEQALETIKANWPPENYSTLREGLEEVLRLAALGNKMETEITPAYVTLSRGYVPEIYSEMPINGVDVIIVDYSEIYDTTGSEVCNGSLSCNQYCEGCPAAHHNVEAFINKVNNFTL